MSRTVSSSRYVVPIGTQYALKGDASTSKMILSQNNSLPLFTNNTAFTITANVLLLTTANNRKTIFSESENSATLTLILFDFGGTAGFLRYFIRNESGATVLNQMAIEKFNTGKWYHVALVDNNGAWRLYINGNADNINSDGALNYTRTVADYTIVNSRLLGAKLVSDSVNPWDSYIKNVKIYNRALSAEEIFQESRFRSVDSTGLIRWYKFNEGSGTTGTDSSASGDTVTITGGSYVTNVPIIPRTFII